MAAPDILYDCISPPPRADGNPDRMAMLHISHDVWTPGVRIRGRSKKKHHLLWVTGGRGVLRGPEGEFALEEAAFCAIAIGEPYEFICGPTDSMHVTVIACVGQGMSDLFHRYLGDPRCRSWPIPNPMEVSDLLTRLRQEACRGDRWVQDFCCQYVRLLLTTVRRALDLVRVHHSYKQRTFLRVKTLLDSHFNRIKSVRQAAAMCGVSAPHLFHLFREMDHGTPAAYLARLKMTRASHLLTDTDSTLREVAQAVGYEDPFVFSKAFKRLVGISPTYYRRHDDWRGTQGHPPKRVPRTVRRKRRKARPGARLDFPRKPD